MGVKYCAILHIYGSRSILLIFYYHQDSESGSCEMEMSTSQLIFTDKKISKVLWYNDIHTIKTGETNYWLLHIYGALAILLLFCDQQDTEFEVC